MGGREGVAASSSNPKQAIAQCSCCYEEINHDQGVACPNKHYLCAHGTDDSEQDCMAHLIESQIHSIRAQNEALLCPVCHEQFACRQVASGVSDAMFGKLQKAIMDSKMMSQTADLQREFMQDCSKKSSGWKNLLREIFLTW